MFSISSFSNSSAISIRANNATQKNIDISSNRIATGSKVSSVKDDSSAYQVSNILKNDSATWEFRHDALKQIEPIFDMFAQYNEDGLTLLRESQQLLAFAANTTPNSAERRRYYDEWQILSSRADDLSIERDYLFNFTGGSSGPGYALDQGGPLNEWAFQPFKNIEFLNSSVMPSNGVEGVTNGVNFPGYTPTVWQVNSNFMGSSQADMAQAAAEQLNSNAGVSRINWATMPYTGGAQSRLDKMAEFSNKLQNIIDNARSKMFDTDLTVESAKLHANQVKSELAMSSISLFGQHYKSVVQNMLGNVMQTQRSVMA